MPEESFETGAYAHPFTTTLWPEVLAAASTEPSPGARAALERLCQRYWSPLYVYLRRQGHSAHEAEDFVQGFFLQLISLNNLRNVGPEKGRFRSFLLASLKNFVSDQRDKAHALKRGGGQKLIELDALAAEQRLACEPVERMDPEKLFDRQWALTLLQNVLERLQMEYRSSGRQEWYERLHVFLLEPKAAVSQAELAMALGVKEAAVSSEVFRMRRRYRELFRDEIAGTVASLEQVQEEMRHLLGALRDV